MTASTLTMERMRADIAATLHEDPSAVGDDDNLMDLGVDSMRVLNLVLYWSDMSGISLEFGEIAEHVTLAGWWSVVRARLEAAEHQANGAR